MQKANLPRQDLKTFINFLEIGGKYVICIIGLGEDVRSWYLVSKTTYYSSGHTMPNTLRDSKRWNDWSISYTMACNIPERNLHSYHRDSFRNISEMTVDQLSAFESVQEVTEFVQIQAKHPNFTSLGFLRNLRVIDGRMFIR